MQLELPSQSFSDLLIFLTQLPYVAIPIAQPVIRRVPTADTLVQPQFICMGFVVKKVILSLL
jgi:hypothetical protein